MATTRDLLLTFCALMGDIKYTKSCGTPLLARLQFRVLRKRLAAAAEIRGSTHTYIRVTKKRNFYKRSRQDQGEFAKIKFTNFRGNTICN